MVSRWLRDDFLSEDKHCLTIDEDDDFFIDDKHDEYFDTSTSKVRKRDDNDFDDYVFLSQ